MIGPAIICGSRWDFSSKGHYVQAGPGQADRPLRPREQEAELGGGEAVPDDLHLVLPALLSPPQAAAGVQLLPAGGLQALRLLLS